MGASGLRDFVVLIVVFGSIPFILRRPYIGILMWSWLAYMNPHKLSWGFAQNFPFSLLIALVTLVAFFINTEIEKKIPWRRESVLLLVFIFWMFITTVFAFYPDLAWQQWDKVWKIQLFTFLTLILINDKEKINMLLLIITLSIGLYGFKGGIFTVLTGGAYAVYGPTGTFIGGNNEIGLAMIMTIPWMRYFYLTAEYKWQRIGMTILIATTTFAILGTQSRGALVGLLLMFAYMSLKNIKQLGFLLIFAGLLFVTIQFMPDSWQARMGTIETYEQDRSAMGRISAWWMAYNLASDNVFGGGFETFRAPLFRLYSPYPNFVHDAHSIYFEILGEHGFIGLGLFLLLGYFGVNTSAQVVRLTKGRNDLLWMHHLGKMMQISLIGYAASGAFLGLAYFDLYYALIAIIVITRTLLDKELKKPPIQVD